MMSRLHVLLSKDLRYFDQVFSFFFQLIESTVIAICTILNHLDPSLLISEVVNHLNQIEVINIDIHYTIYTSIMIIDYFDPDNSPSTVQCLSNYHTKQLDWQCWPSIVRSLILSIIITT